MEPTYIGQHDPYSRIPLVNLEGKNYYAVAGSMCSLHQLAHSTPSTIVFIDIDEDQLRWAEILCFTIERCECLDHFMAEYLSWLEAKYIGMRVGMPTFRTKYGKLGLTTNPNKDGYRQNVLHLGHGYLTFEGYAKVRDAIRNRPIRWDVADLMHYHYDQNSYFYLSACSVYCPDKVRYVTDKNPNLIVGDSR